MRQGFGDKLKSGAGKNIGKVKAAAVASHICTPHIPLAGKLILQ